MRFDDCGYVTGSENGDSSSPIGGRGGPGAYKTYERGFCRFCSPGGEGLKICLRSTAEYPGLWACG